MSRQSPPQTPGTTGWRHRAQLGLLVLVAVSVWAMFAVAFLPGVAPVLQDILCAVAGDCLSVREAVVPMEAG